MLLLNDGTLKALGAFSRGAVARAQRAKQAATRGALDFRPSRFFELQASNSHPHLRLTPAARTSVSMYCALCLVLNVVALRDPHNTFFQLFGAVIGIC